MATQKRFRFLDLPPEIRDMVYHVAFEGKHELRATKIYPFRAPALLVTSKQIYQEAILVFYSTTVFLVPADWDLLDFLNLLERFQQATSTIRLFMRTYAIKNVERAIREFERWVYEPPAMEAGKLRKGVLQVAMDDGSGDELVWTNGSQERGREHEVPFFERWHWWMDDRNNWTGPDSGLCYDTEFARRLSSEDVHFWRDRCCH